MITTGSSSGARSASSPALSAVVDMSCDLAQHLIKEAQDEARRRGLRLSFAVVDRGGNSVAALRDDGSQLGAANLAADKAFTAVSFGMPTRVWALSSVPGQPDWGLANTLGGRAVVFPGGVPLYMEDMLVGALGVSGASADIDEECAVHAADRLGLKVAR